MDSSPEMAAARILIGVLPERSSHGRKYQWRRSDISLALILKTCTPITRYRRAPDSLKDLNG